MRSAPAAHRCRVTLTLAHVAAATACGLEDPNSVAAQRGALQLAYPKALHVGRRCGRRN